MKSKIVLSIIAVLVLLIGLNLPPFHRVRARARSAAEPCKNNLRYIDGAINEWALENHKTNGTPVTFEDIKPFIQRTGLNSSGEITPCPMGGKYRITVVGEEPTCSFGTNSTPIWNRISDYVRGEESLDAERQHHRLPD